MSQRLWSHLRGKDTMSLIKYLAFIIAFSASALAQAAISHSAADSSAASTVDASKTVGDRLNQELKAIREALPGKKKELARLRHKWVVAKGRIPSEKELIELDKKLDKGEVTYENNPYINKNPLSTPGPARLAYYKKLEEVRKDEDRVRRLEKEIQSLALKPAGAPGERPD